MSSFVGRPPSKFKRLKWKIRGYVPFSNWWLVWKKLDKGSKSILDLGCGVGSPMKFINRHKQFYTVGVEGFMPYVTQCQIEQTHDLVIHGDIRSLPFRSKTFDTVICLQVLEHLEKPDGELLLEEMERLAKKQVIVTTDINEYVQGAIDGNELQIHRYIWGIEELQEKGFKTHGLSLKGYSGETGYGRHLPEFPRWLIATTLQTLIGIIVYHFPRYAGSAICIKNMY